MSTGLTVGCLVLGDCDKQGRPVLQLKHGLDAALAVRGGVTHDNGPPIVMQSTCAGGASHV
jgi:hypothetical protein